jgi:hypothetical protein
MDLGPDWGGEVAMGLGYVADGFSFLFSDGDGSKRGTGVYHDDGALFGLDHGKADGSSELAGGGFVGVVNLGSASGGGYWVSALVSSCGRADGDGGSASGTIDWVGEARSLDSLSIGGALEKGRAKSMGGGGDGGGSLSGGVGGIVSSRHSSFSSNHSSGAVG